MRDAERLTIELAGTLVAEQFPHWAELDIEVVAPGGHDNRTFRLGPEFTIRLPTDEGYVDGELKEHEWLARLAPVLPLRIPEVVGVGRPSADFRRPWSIRRWIPGDTATWDRIADPVDFARDLAGFLVALRSADTEGAPEAGAQSFFRGTHPSSYDEDTRSTIAKIADELDVAHVISVWERALASEWSQQPVWFHGDVASGNLIVADGRLRAVIDFGTSGIGDPACDTVIAWTLLTGAARDAYRDALGLDEQTWDRGRGWALWKALITIAEHREKNPLIADEARRVLAEVLA
jgi:aminoglycoside phosphotransferase (APT) family kinase protein